MATSAQLEKFFTGLEQPNEHLFKIYIDKKSLYHLDHLDSVEARTIATVTAPEIKHGVDVFGNNVVAINFIHSSLLDVVIDKEEANFGKIKSEDECDCYCPECEFPIHVKATYADGTAVEKELSEFFGEDCDCYEQITDALKAYMPYSVIKERIESYDLKPFLTDEVISKLLWPKHHTEN